MKKLKKFMEEYEKVIDKSWRSVKYEQVCEAILKSCWNSQWIKINKLVKNSKKKSDETHEEIWKSRKSSCRPMKKYENLHEEVGNSLKSSWKYMKKLQKNHEEEWNN